MKIVAQNRRARFDYDILETVEAGLMLSGQEVKSCRAGHVDLRGSYVSFREGKPILKSAKISPYHYALPLPEYQPSRERTLLLRASEAARLQSAVDEKGMTIVPLEVRAGRYIKVLLGLGRGRKRIDKRRVIRERDVERRLRRGEHV